MAQFLHARHSPTLLVAALVSLGLACSLASAQSAYTMSVLAKPSGAVSFLPTSIDNSGVVRGGMQYVSGYRSARGETGCFLFCPNYLGREVSWPAASTSGTASARLGLRGFFGFMGNDQGLQIGHFQDTPEKQPTVLQPNVRNIVPPSLMFSYPYLLDHALSPGGTPAPLYPQDGARWRPTDVNNSGTMVGLSSFNISGVIYPLPIVVRHGSETRLPMDLYPSGHASGINEAGVIVGQVNNTGHLANGSLPPGVQPAMWVDGRFQVIGDATLRGVEAIAVNNAGQVLLQSVPRANDSSSEAYVWSGGVTTKLSNPPNQSVHVIAINDAGTVVGCTRNIKPMADLTRADLTAVVWRNGVAQDLSAELEAKGVTLPAGTRLGCPLGINNQGSILAYHYKLSAPDTLTWVRFNAKP